MGTKSKPKNLRVWRYRPLQPHHLISIQYLRFNFLQMTPFTWIFICPSNNAFTSISCFSMSHQRATWEKVRGASLSNFKDQANRPRGWSDVLLQGHHLKIFQVQAVEALRGEASIAVLEEKLHEEWWGDKRVRGEPWVCVCVRNEQEQTWKWLSTNVL